MLADLTSGEVRELAEAVLAADVKFDDAVRLLGVQQPDQGEVRAATYGGVIVGGRWGSVGEPHGAADIAAAMGFLAELMDVAHVQASRGVASTQPAFGLVSLARKACVARGGAVPLDAGVELLRRDVFGRLSVKAERRRTRLREPPLLYRDPSHRRSCERRAGAETGEGRRGGQVGGLGLARWGSDRWEGALRTTERT
eukprot:5451807-Pleurochrysis_carterae.AAC.1